MTRQEYLDVEMYKEKMKEYKKNLGVHQIMSTIGMAVGGIGDIDGLRAVNHVGGVHDQQIALLLPDLRGQGHNVLLDQTHEVFFHQLHLVTISG